MENQPTSAELRILEVLWQLGSATARQVHNELQRDKATNYATTVKMLNVLRAKELVTCDSSQRPQQFKAAVSKKKSRTSALRKITSDLFGGSSSELILQALSSKKPSEEELEQIHAVVHELLQRKQGGKK